MLTMKMAVVYDIPLEISEEKRSLIPCFAIIAMNGYQFSASYYAAVYPSETVAENLIGFTTILTMVTASYLNVSPDIAQVLRYFVVFFRWAQTNNFK